MKKYLNLLAKLIADSKSQDFEENLIELIKEFLALYEVMDINLFYLSKQFILNNAEKYSIPCTEIIPLEKEIITLDDAITKLQIPKIAFIWNRIESNIDVYQKESDLYNDIRKILLNKNKYVRNYKPIINYYLSLIIEALESVGDIGSYVCDEAELYQFEEIIRLAKLMLADAKIDVNNKVSLTMRNDPIRIYKIARKYK